MEDLKKLSVTPKATFSRADKIRIAKEVAGLATVVVLGLTIFGLFSIFYNTPSAPVMSTSAQEVPK